jgi:hypothetical protein
MKTKAKEHYNLPDGSLEIIIHKTKFYFLDLREKGIPFEKRNSRNF